MTKKRASKGIKRTNKTERQDKKRKKLAALLAVTQLNDVDGRAKAFVRNVKDPVKQQTEQVNNGEPPSKKTKTENKQENPGEKKPKNESKFEELSELGVKELQRLCRERFKLKCIRPNIKVNELGLKSSIETPKESRIPMFLSDVQHFLIYTQQLHHSIGNLPRWIKLERPKSIDHAISLIIEGVSYLDYENNKSECPNMSKFDNKLEIVTPLSYGGEIISELATVPLTNNQINKIEKTFGSLKEACDVKKVCKVLRTIYPVGDITNKKIKHEVEGAAGEDDAFPRTQLLLTPWQMVENNYPLPLEGELKAKYADYVFTKDTYEEVSDKSPMWAIDCEMCITCKGSELTEISVVDENCRVMYRTLVKPYNPIRNYLTRFSGITKARLDPIWTRLEDVQQKLREILPPNVILVGHSLDSDLHAMKMLHPYIIDTSVIFNMSGIPTRKTGLRVLCAEYLSEKIQAGADGHDPTEDAAAAMKLLKAKLQRSIGWGNAIISGVRPIEESIAAQQLLMEKERNKGNEVKHKKQDPQPKNEINVNKFTFENNVAKRNKNSSGSAFMYMSSILKHLTAGERKVLLVGKKNEIDEYERFVPPTYKLGSPKCPVRRTILETNKAVVKFGRDNLISDGLTYMHVVVQNHIKADKLVGKLLKNIIDGEDKHKNILVSVLLTGKNSDIVLPNSNHGLLLVHMFRKYVAPIPVIKVE